MSETEEKILDTFEKVLPEMTVLEQEKLLSFGQGLGFMKGVMTFEGEEDKAGAKEKKGVKLKAKNEVL